MIELLETYVHSEESRNNYKTVMSEGNDLSG